MALHENLGRHVGVRASDIRGTLLRVLAHAVAMGAIAFASERTALRLGWSLWKPRLAHAVAALAVIICFDSGLAHAKRREGHPQWSYVIDRHPLRIEAFDRLLGILIDEKTDIKAAQHALAQLIEQQAAGHFGPSATFAGRDGGQVFIRRNNVLVIAIEGLNSRLADATTMPNMFRLAGRGALFRSHYSTGNSTSYGVLGLVHGAAPVFYQVGQPRSSTYLERFRAAGYVTHWLGSAAVEFRMSDYLGNFDRPAPPDDSDESNVARIAQALGVYPANFVFVYYADSHWPYKHLPSFSKFIPEVSEDFDFGREDLIEYRTPIENRYKNCLAQADAWLGRVLEHVDLSKTVVVVTGDHGEELFENGHLSHSSSLGEPMIRTPLILWYPGIQPGQEVGALTSHAAILPAIQSLLRTQVLAGDTGIKAMLDNTAGRAFVAMNNQGFAANIWAVVTQQGKSIVRRSDNGIELQRLYDRNDGLAEYSKEPPKWGDNLSAVAEFQAIFHTDEPTKAQAR